MVEKVGVGAAEHGRTGQVDDTDQAVQQLRF